MSERIPSVSIGMPVFNGGPFVAEAIETLLAQSHDDFELIISDNASTDGTAEICREHAARDHRLHYLRNPENIGPVANFNRVLSLARGEYFMWASHDDMWHPTYVERCLAGFPVDPTIVLVGTAAELIDASTGERIVADPGISTIGLRADERFMRYKRTIHSNTHYGGIFYGLYRRSALLKVAPLKNVLATDHLILAHLCFFGSFYTVPETLFFKRWGGASTSFAAAAAVMGIAAPSNNVSPWFWREIYLQRIIRDTGGLSAVERVRLGAWSWMNYLQRHGGAQARTWPWVNYLRNHGGSRARRWLHLRLRVLRGSDATANRE